MNLLINISEAASLGFHGLALMAEEAPRRINVKKAAEALHVSEAHLAKVFQTLAKAGFISSQRGPAGGFILNRPADELSFLDIYEALEAPVHLEECPLGNRFCGFHKCIFDKKLNDLSREIIKTFEGIRLSQFLPSKGSREEGSPEDDQADKDKKSSGKCDSRKEI